MALVTSPELEMDVEFTKVRSRLSDVDFDGDSTNHEIAESGSSRPSGTEKRSADPVNSNTFQYYQAETCEASFKSSTYPSSSKEHLIIAHDPRPFNEAVAAIPSDTENEGEEQRDGGGMENESHQDVQDGYSGTLENEGVEGINDGENVGLEAKAIVDDVESTIMSEGKRAPNVRQNCSSNIADAIEMTGNAERVQNDDGAFPSRKDLENVFGEQSNDQADVFKQLGEKDSLIEESVMTNNNLSGAVAESIQVPLSQNGKCSLSPVSNCTDSDSENETEKENRLRAALEFLLFPPEDSNADDARMALNQVMRSLRIGTKFHTKRLDRFLREVYRAMKDFEENQFVQERACIVLGKIARGMPSTQRTIAETAGVKHIMEAIKRHTECDTVQDKGIFSLLSLTDDPVAREHIVEERGAECVSWAMTEFQDIRSILTNGSTTLCNIAFGCEETKMRIGKVGGIGAVVNAMNRHQGDAELQGLCCQALRTLTCGLRASQWIAGRACAMESIVRCMKSFPRDVNIQDQGCAALANICSTESENRDRATGIGAIETCIKAMKSNMDHIGLIEHSLAVLRNLCIGNEENQLRIGAADGLDLVVHALKQYRTNKKILVRGCSALRFMFFARPNREAMFECEGLELLLRILRDGEHIPEVAESAILALGNAIFDHKEAKRLVGRYGGIAAVVDVMSKHLDSEKIQEYGCRALRNLADSDELNTRLLGDSGAVDTAVYAIMGYPNNAEIQEHSCAMLFNMAFSEHNMRIMKDLEVARVVEHATQFHLQNSAIQCQAMALLQRIRLLTKASSNDHFSRRGSASVMAKKKSSDLRKNGSAGNLNKLRSRHNQVKKKHTARLGRKR